MADLCNNIITALCSFAAASISVNIANCSPSTCAVRGTIGFYATPRRIMRRRPWLSKIDTLLKDNT